MDHCVGTGRRSCGRIVSCEYGSGHGSRTAACPCPLPLFQDLTMNVREKLSIICNMKQHN